MLNSTQPAAGRKRVAMMTNRLSFTASCAISAAAFAFPAARKEPTTLLSASVLMACCCRYANEIRLSSVVATANHDGYPFNY